MLAHTFDKHTKQEFFNRVHKKGKYEDTVTTHMNFYRVFKLLEMTLIKGFKKNVDNRYRWFENIQ